MGMGRSPKVEALVVNAIRKLQELQGSTSREISNYISQEYDVPRSKIRRHVQMALHRGVSYGILQRSKGGYYTYNRNSMKTLTNENNLTSCCGPKRAKRRSKMRGGCKRRARVKKRTKRRGGCRGGSRRSGRRGKGGRRRRKRGKSVRRRRGRRRGRRRKGGKRGGKVCAEEPDLLMELRRRDRASSKIRQGSERNRSRSSSVTFNGTADDSTRELEGAPIESPEVDLD